VAGTFMTTTWQLTPDLVLTLDQPRVVGILNLTPDSFSDGGLLPTIADALHVARRLVSEGADILDLGGESTRPGSHSVSAEEQIQRVIPVIEAIRRDPQLRAIPLSIDTTLAPVAAAVINAGANVINDTSAGLDDSRMLPLAAQSRAGLILMHRLRRPANDSYSDRYSAPPIYNDVVAEVKSFLAGRARAATDAGIDPSRIVLDPGLGFGKTVEQNLELIRRTKEFLSLGFPILSGASRKSFVGRAAGLTDSTPRDRPAASIGISIAHYYAGARIFRVHEVGPQAQALRAAAAAKPPL
jgi:dihydropteroate synthase